MYKNVLKYSRVAAIFLLMLGHSFKTEAQMTLTGQLRTRGEDRNGYGNLVAPGVKDADFISQRTRLNFGYKWDLLTFGVSVQDVRVWGADASTMSALDGNRLALHEGWAEFTLNNKADTTIKFKLFDMLSLKIGRQELVYDDSRLIGNLDWVQQARTHDMALLKVVHHGWQVDLGAAFNQNAENSSNITYVPGNIPLFVTNSLGNYVAVPVAAGFVPLAPGGSTLNKSAAGGTPVYSNPPSTNGASQDYKSFLSLYVSKKFDQTKVSALFFNDNFGVYNPQTLTTPDGGFIYGRRFVATPGDSFDYSGSYKRYTYGLMVSPTFGNASDFGKVAIQAAYYKQSGKNRDGWDMNAYHYSIALTYQKDWFSVTPGYDVLSGTTTDDITAKKDNSFDPLYGTPHKFRGYMDYFYAGTGSPKGGLVDPYIKFKYIGSTLSAGVDLYYFMLDKDMKNSIDGTILDKHLGNEADFTVSYAMNKFTQIDLGYSIMKATSSMPFAKAQPNIADASASNYSKSPSWAYIMFKFTPDFLFVKPVAIRQ